MNVNIRNRFVVFGIFLIALFAIIFVQLIKLTLIDGDAYAAKSKTLTERKIAISGARGSILDRNGLPLAYDQKSYNVQFYRDPTKSTATDRAFYTNIIIQTIDIVEENGGKTIDTFVIRYEKEKGTFIFDWGDISESAKESREKNWRENMYVGSERTPEQIYLYLREKYQIPSEMGYDEARKILSIWQDVQLASWVAYKPVDVAYNVSKQTVADIETHRAELKGMSIAESTVRVYPKGAVAAHIIGYLGRITDEEELAELQNLGYRVDDLVGVEGIEETMESYLTGNSIERQGVKVVEIDNMAVVRNEISSTDPKQGNNVVLTIDIPLQLAVEKSLKENIPRIKSKQLDLYEKEKDGDYKDIDLKDINLAESGAAVVLDVSNGDVLAISSYPSFDLNLFSGGISFESYEALSKDPAAPLYNKAVSGRGTPGSIFKMVTGLGGLMENVLTLSEKIDDEGEYTKILLPNGHGPSCWQKNTSKHQGQTIVEGLQNSCNYFFFTVADRLGIELLNKWGEKFGLTGSTGIELPGEAIGQVGNQSILFDPTKSINQQKTYTAALVKNGQFGIVKLINGFAEALDVKYDDELVDETADELIYLAGIKWIADGTDSGILKDENGITMGHHVRKILSDRLQISEKRSRANKWDVEITNMLTQLQWSLYDTITTGIGQGYIQVTPIAVARYVASIANGGLVYETHVVDKVVDQDGTVVFDQQPVVSNTLDAPGNYLAAIKKGMGNVVNAENGTATGYFKDFEYKDQIGGKTGTAEVSKIDLENNSWFVCFAPYDTPKIAVVVYVPHGYSGGLSSYVAQDIVKFYLDREKMVAEQTIPDSGSLVH
ncbi:MAG: penicillin-binding transpeptidase domain-containing protein [Christensenellales bacterium]|jgi:penicillin-binding protein 2